MQVGTICWDPPTFSERLDEILDRFKDEVFAAWGHWRDELKPDAVLCFASHSSSYAISPRSRIHNPATGGTSAKNIGDTVQRAFFPLGGYGLGSLPLELFEQVASELEPIDLLHLSRTSRWLRAILMSKRSLKLWKSAMGKVIRASMPPLPEGLNEPTYTALMFDNHCFACGVTDAYAVDYALRVRFCEECFEENVVEGSQVLGDVPSSLREVVMILTPAEARHRTFESSDSYQDGAIELTNPLSHTLEDFYLKTDLESMMFKLSSLPSDWERLKSTMEDHAQYVVQRQITAMRIHGWQQITCRREWQMFDMILRFNSYLGSLLKECSLPKHHCFTYEQNCERLHLISKAISEHDLRLKSLARVNREMEVQLARQAAVTERRYNARLLQLREFYDYFVSKFFRKNDSQLDLLPNNRLGAYYLKMYAASDFARGRMPQHDEWDDYKDAYSVIFDNLEYYAQAVKQGCAALLLGVRHPPALSEPVSDGPDAKLFSRIVRFHGEKNIDDKETRALEGELDTLLARPNALFVCTLCPASTEVYAYDAAHAHYRSAHGDVADFLRRFRVEGNTNIYVPAWLEVWEGGATLVSRIVQAAHLPEDVNMYTLDELVRDGELACVCGDPSLARPSEMNWAQFVQHIHRHVEWARLQVRLPGKRKKTRKSIATDDIMNDDHADLTKCIRYHPGTKVDTPNSPSSQTTPRYLPIVDHRVKADPYTRARINAHLAGASEESVLVCRICDAAKVRRKALPEPLLTKSADDVVYHMRAKHLKGFHEKDVVVVER